MDLNYVEHLRRVLADIDSGNIAPPLTKPPDLPPVPSWLKLPSMSGEATSRFQTGRARIPFGDEQSGGGVTFGATKVPEQRPMPYVGFDYTRRF